MISWLSLCVSFLLFLSQVLFRIVKHSFRNTELSTNYYDFVDNYFKTEYSNIDQHFLLNLSELLNEACKYNEKRTF